MGDDDAIRRWQLQLGLAVTHDLMGQPVEAIHCYRAFVEEAKGDARARGDEKWAHRVTERGR